MLKKIVVILLVLVFAFGGFVAYRPSIYRVERSAVVRAPAAEVYSRVADLTKWEGWSPWAKLDPAMKLDYSGTPGTVGSTYHWKGNDKVGEGRMTVKGLTPDRQVVIELQFLKPWEQTSLTTFDLAPDPAGTKVTWSMTGQHDFIGKLFAVFMDMDGMVGPDFEKGLTALKERARD